MQKRILISVVILVISVTLMSCGADEKVDQTVVVRLCAPQNAYIEDFETNSYKLWLEEQTGLKIEMIWLPEKDAQRLVKQALLTGDGLPDAYVGFDSGDIFKSPNIQSYGEQGAVLALDELIEKYGVNTKQVWDELSEYSVKELMTSADGHIYFMPGFSSSTITRYRQIMWVNKGWLDKLNLPIPSTTEDFQNMLYAFATQDPNGNGINDEIPLAGTEDYQGKQVYDYVLNAFIYNNEKNMRLLLENGKVDFAPLRDEWRDGLRYLNMLYEKGLISPLSFTQDDQQMKQMANDPRDILGSFTTSGITYTVQQNSPEIMERYVGIPPLTGPTGKAYATVSIPLPKPNGVITSACKYPEEVFKLFDLMLSEEACLRGRYGEQGVDWDFADEGDVSIYGSQATIRIHNQLWNVPQNKHLKQIVPYISRPKFSSGVTWDGTKTDGEYMNAQAAMLYTNFEPDEFVGTLVYTPDEEAAIQKKRGDIEVHVKQTIKDFIMGVRDINNDEEWGSYKMEFNDIGLQDFLKVAQIAQDRTKK